MPCLVAGLALAGCGDDKKADETKAPESDIEADTTMAALNQAQKITIGTKFDQPLFGLKGLSGQPEGFDVEIAKIIVDELGIPDDKITWIETPSGVREEKIIQGAVDMVAATYTINATRKERVSFAGPYYVAGQDLMVKKDNTTITGPESLKAAKARVCSVSGLDPGREDQDLHRPGTARAVRRVLQVRRRACAPGRSTLSPPTTSSSSGSSTRAAERSSSSASPSRQEPYGIGIKKGDVQFCKFINDALQKAVADGRYKAAWEKTAGKVAGAAPALPPADACV